MTKSDPIRRLEARVERIPESGCWIWMGGIDTRGSHLPYGKFWLGTRSIPAHRAAWKLFCGEIPEGQSVLHRCDVPCCVNPAHLFVGTPKENTQDMIAKGRHAPMVETRRGERNNFNKLSAQQVAEIRAATGKQRDIAARFGVSQPCVSLIKRRINWSHL